MRQGIGRREDAEEGAGSSVHGVLKLGDKPEERGGMRAAPRPCASLQPCHVPDPGIPQGIAMGAARWEERIHTCFVS